MLGTEHPEPAGTDCLAPARGKGRLTEELAGQAHAEAKSRAPYLARGFRLRFHRHVVGDAVAEKPRAETFAVIGAVDSQVLAHPARLRAPVAQSLLQQVSTGEKALHQDRLAAEQVAHHYPRLAGAGEQRIVLDRERPRGDLRGLAQRVVDEKLERARCSGLPGECRYGLRDESRGQREITVELHAAEIDLPSPGP